MSTIATEELDYRVGRAKRRFEDARLNAADKLTAAIQDDLAVTSWDCEAVVDIAETQAIYVAWVRCQDRVEGGASVEKACATTAERLLETVRPGNSTGHGHRAFDTGACEGTLRAVRELNELADLCRVGKRG